MMLLAPTDTPAYRKAASKHPALFGWFLTPRKRGIPATLTETAAKFGIDNDQLNDKTTPDQYITWLETLAPWSDRCLFAPCPDEVTRTMNGQIIGNWPATLEKFWFYQPIIAATGYPVALVLQDGATAETIPWHKIDAVFVGGSTKWKLSQHVLALLHEAGHRAKWRHVGRVNSQTRVNHFWRSAESFDGTFMAKSPDRALRRLGPHILHLANQPTLFWGPAYRRSGHGRGRRQPQN